MKAEGEIVDNLELNIINFERLVGGVIHPVV